MTAEDLVMVIDKAHFIVKLHSNLLEVDLKEGVRKHIEDFVEANPTLRGTLGTLFQFAIPLDVPLKDIQSVKLDDKGQVKIVIPHRRDLTIPLEREDAQKLINKLNELIPIEKEREIERIMEDAAARREEAARRGEEEFMAREAPKG
jgi:hypothetical protein